jgi:hypothetical protein
MGIPDRLIMGIATPKPCHNKLLSGLNPYFFGTSKSAVGPLHMFRSERERVNDLIDILISYS